MDIKFLFSEIFNSQGKQLTKKVNPQKNEFDELLTVEQFTKFLNLTKPTIYSKISKRELPILKRSKRCYFLREDLINYLKEGRRKTRSEISLEAESLLIKGKGRKK